jgi:GT2 family glycosyltransferase
LTPNVEARPRVAAIVCFRDKAEMTLAAVRSLLRSADGVDLELVLVDNGSSAQERALIAPFVSSLGVPATLVSFPGAFNFNRMHNWTVREHTSAPVLLFLNNDVVFQRVDLAQAAAWALQPGIGTVGMMMRFEHGGMQNAGIRAWFGGEARLARIGNSHAEDPIVFENREVFANTFAACLVRRAAFDAVGGLREKDLVNGFGDVAFCLETARRGWHHWYMGSQVATHAEGSSRGKIPYEYWEEFGVERDFPEMLQKMVREDLGFNRVPGGDDALRPLLLQALKQRFRKNSRWLDPLKPTLKKWLSRVLPVEDGV